MNRQGAKSAKDAEGERLVQQSGMRAGKMARQVAGQRAGSISRVRSMPRDQEAGRLR